MRTPADLAPLAVASIFALLHSAAPAHGEPAHDDGRRLQSLVGSTIVLSGARAPSSLPPSPRALARLLAPGGIGPDSVAADSRGIVVALSHLPLLVALDFAGDTLHERWRRTLRDPVASGPSILGDGTRVVLTGGGEVLGFSPNGAQVFRSDGGPLLGTARPAPIALPGGGVAFAIGGTLLLADQDGRIRERPRVSDHAVQALASTRLGLLAIDETGDVSRAGLTTLVLGAFGGEVGTGAVHADERALVAVVDHRRVVDFDLATSTTHDRFVAPTASLEGRIALGRDGTAYVTTFTGTLLALDPSGNELFRTALEPGGVLSGANGALNPDAIAPAPPLLVDESGRAAFTRPGGRTGVVGPNGAVDWVKEATCPSPVAMCPTGAGRFVVACRDGSVLLIGGS